MRSYSTPSSSITNPTNVEYDPENVLPMSIEKQSVWLDAVWSEYKSSKQIAKELAQELPPLLKVTIYCVN